MSVRVMADIFDRFPEGGSERLMMLALADHANDDGASIYPSVPSIASKVRLKERRVRQLLAKLVEDGWLIVDHRGAGGYKAKADITQYRIELAKLHAMPLLPHAQARADKTRPGARSQTGVQRSAPLAARSRGVQSQATGVQRSAPLAARSRGVQSQATGVQSGAQRGAAQCTQNIQTEPSEESSQAAAAAVGEERAARPVCVSVPAAEPASTSAGADARRDQLAEQARRLRNRKRAEQMLRDQGVWERTIPELVAAAAKRDVGLGGIGDALGPIETVIAAAEREREKARKRGKPLNPAKWITAAIREGWDVAGDKPQRRKSA